MPYMARSQNLTPEHTLRYNTAKQSVWEDRHVQEPNPKPCIHPLWNALHSHVPNTKSWTYSTTLAIAQHSVLWNYALQFTWPGTKPQTLNTSSNTAQYSVLWDGRPGHRPGTEPQTPWAHATPLTPSLLHAENVDATQRCCLCYFTNPLVQCSPLHTECKLSVLSPILRSTSSSLIKPNYLCNCPVYDSVCVCVCVRVCVRARVWLLYAMNLENRSI